MTFRKKLLSEYEAEAVWDGTCLLHPLEKKIARKVYMMRHGVLPSWLFVCHTCDTPRCINDLHHFVGTSKDNHQDAVRKGRHPGFISHGPEIRRRMSISVKKAWSSLNAADRLSRGRCMSKAATTRWAKVKNVRPS